VALGGCVVLCHLMMLRCNLLLRGVDDGSCCVEMCRLATFAGDPEILTDILEDVLKSFEDVCIDNVSTVHVCSLCDTL